MAEVIDLTGDGGVLKTIVKKAKPDAIAPSENLPLLDGNNTLIQHYENNHLEVVHRDFLEFLYNHSSHLQHLSFYWHID